MSADTVNTHYLRVGQWSECLHCHTFFAGDFRMHYCGAPWQTRPPLDGLDGISAERAAKAEAARRSVSSAPCPTPDLLDLLAEADGPAGDGWEAEARRILRALCGEDSLVIERVTARALKLRAVASSGEVPSSASVGLNALAKDVHERNRKWWYAADGSPLARNKGELLMLMLIVTEVAEAMEGERKNLMDDKLPHRKMAEVELVDVIVRVLDYAGAFGYDLDGAYAEKLAFNATRSDHKAEAAKIAAGAGL